MQTMLKRKQSRTQEQSLIMYYTFSALGVSHVMRSINVLYLLTYNTTQCDGYRNYGS